MNHTMMQAIPPEKLEALLADIRDMFPAPPAGSHLERAYDSAMCSAEYVPEYVEQCLAAAEHSRKDMCAVLMNVSVCLADDLEKSIEGISASLSEHKRDVAAVLRAAQRGLPKNEKHTT